MVRGHVPPFALVWLVIVALGLSAALSGVRAADVTLATPDSSDVATPPTVLPLAIPDRMLTCDAQTPMWADSSWPIDVRVAIPLCGGDSGDATWLDEGSDAVGDLMDAEGPHNRESTAWYRAVPRDSDVAILDSAVDDLVGRTVDLPLYDIACWTDPVDDTREGCLDTLDQGGGPDRWVHVTRLAEFTIERAFVAGDGADACDAAGATSCVVGVFRSARDTDAEPGSVPESTPALPESGQSHAPSDPATPAPPDGSATAPADDPSPKPTAVPGPSTSPSPEPSPESSGPVPEASKLAPSGPVPEASETLPARTTDATQSTGPTWAPIPVTDATPSLSSTFVDPTDWSWAPSPATIGTPSLSLSLADGAAQAGGSTSASSPMDGPSSMGPSASYIQLNVPARVSIPLARSNGATVMLPAGISSDGAWQLTVVDSSRANPGHMTAGSVSLSSVMSIINGSGTAMRLDGGSRLPVASGTNDAYVPLRLYQYVSPYDKPGAYDLTLVFEAISVF